MDKVADKVADMVADKVIDNEKKIADMELDMAFLSKGAILPWAGSCGRKAKQSPNTCLPNGT